MINPLWLVVAASLIALLPVAVGLLTSYIKISIVLGMLRSGIGAQQVPSGLVIMALSLAMTLFIMGPVISRTAEIAREVGLPDAAALPSRAELTRVSAVALPWREFMERHAGRRELAVLAELESQPVEGSPVHAGEVSLRILIPAFVLTEIKEGFAMGFVLLLPFLAIDLVVANILAGLGMYMLSPVMISLPLKLILFVSADGWLLLTKGLIGSYAG